MKNKVSYSLILIFAIIEIISIYFFVTKKIEVKSFLLISASSVLGIISQKLSIDKRNKKQL